MLIIIISDSHDNMVNIDRMLEFAKNKKAQVILHCGDVCAPEALKHLAQNFKGDIFHVFGNGDLDTGGMEAYAKDFANLYLLGEFGSPKINGLDLSIGMTHYPDIAQQKAQEGGFDYIFYGHSHKPWISEVSGTMLINPGTLKNSFAFWNTENKEPELKIL